MKRSCGGTADDRQTQLTRRSASVDKTVKHIFCEMTHQGCLRQVLHLQAAGTALLSCGRAHLLHRLGVVLPDVPECLRQAHAGQPSASTGQATHMSGARACAASYQHPVRALDSDSVPCAVRLSCVVLRPKPQTDFSAATGSPHEKHKSIWRDKPATEDAGSVPAAARSAGLAARVSIGQAARSAPSGTVRCAPRGGAARGCHRSRRRGSAGARSSGCSPASASRQNLV